MSKYIDVDELRSKIYRLIMKETSKSGNLWDEGFSTCGEEINDIIDSLQQEQSIQVSTLTWRDINDIERIINNVHYEFRNGIGEKSFGEEVLERFREERDELEQPEVDLEKEYKEWWENKVSGNVNIQHTMEWYMHETARHFYDMGRNARKK